jgi:tetratricopeptide (TPR) repeat protein
LFVPIIRLSRVSVIASLVFAILPLAAHAHGDIHERIDAATLAIKADPTNAQLYVVRGDLHCEHQEYAEANADYDSAAKLDPNLAVVDFCRAKLLALAGEYSSARKTFDAYLARVPNDGRALAERGRLLARLNVRKDAVADFNRALTLLQDPPPEIFLERANVQLADGQTEAALRGLDEGIKALGPIVTLQVRAIEVDLVRTNYDSAVTRLDTIINQSARKENWLLKRGDVLLRAGKTEAASESYRKAIEAIQALSSRLQASEAMFELKRSIEQKLNTVTNVPAQSKP